MDFNVNCTCGKNVWASTKLLAKKQAKSCCTVATIKRRLPIIGWIKGYNLTAFQYDLIAGVTIGLTIIPQGIAYASVAGLNPQYGLYTAIMGCFVYCILGSTREVNVGPIAIVALLTAQQTKIGGEAYAVLLAFICGCVELLIAIFNLGFLIDFIPVPAISGFTSAAALIIAATQIGGLLGLTIKSDNFFMGIYETFKNIPDTKIPDLIMGIICLIILFSLRKLNTVKWDGKDAEIPPSTCKLISRKVLWLLCTARNVLVVIIAAIIKYIMVVNGVNWLQTSGNVEPGLPEFKPPPFSVERNGTTIGFLEICGDFGSSIILVPLVSFLEHLAIAKVFAQGKSVDVKQEFIALGVSNILGSFVSAFPCSGSFSRSALNGSCGVKTPFGGLYTGAIVLLALGFLAPTFAYIPKASLSAVIICAVIVLIEYEMVAHLWKTTKVELFIMLATFICCLALSAQYGILIGIGLSLIVLLYTSARPKIKIESTSAREVEFIRLQPAQNLFYPAVEYLRQRVEKATICNDDILLVFDGSLMSSVDYTIARVIKEIYDDCKRRNQTIVFINLKKDVVELFHRMNALEICNTYESEIIIHANGTNPKLDTADVVIETTINALNQAISGTPHANGIISILDSPQSMPNSVLNNTMDSDEDPKTAELSDSHGEEYVDAEVDTAFMRKSRWFNNET